MLLIGRCAYHQVSAEDPDPSGRPARTWRPAAAALMKAPSPECEPRVYLAAAPPLAPVATPASESNKQPST